MTKKGPLGRAERFYIEQHCDKKDSNTLAKELDRAIGLVDKYVLKYKELRTKAGGQFARQEGVVVMTANASERGDEWKQSKKKNQSVRSCTTTIKRHEDPE